jgi:fibro-slime domain-containing protein
VRLFLSSFATASIAATLLSVGACSAPDPNPSDDGSGAGANNPGVGGGAGSLDGAGGGPGIIVDDDPDPQTNPCLAEDAPEDCEVEAPPACGDGLINLDPPEACDDGNSKPGDGCSGACIIEPFHVCPTPGELCVTTIECGDGEVGPGEACDDRNNTDGDGCSASCNAIEPGFSCRLVGEPCVRVYLCGDGTVDPNEGCDDGAREPSDGCDERCRMESGFKCDGNPSVCGPTTCGDGLIEGAESCDDGNAFPFDGCSPTCQAEPVCAPGQACSSTCGDGITLNDERCDDGNLRDGDGCSSACQVEEGYNCSQPEGCEGDECVLRLPIIYRDFAEAHSDFGVECDEIQRGIPKDMLTAARKPELSASNFDAACIDSVASYADWYTDVASNAEVVGSIDLYPDGNGGYVNRYGENGEPYVTTIDTGNEQGGYGNSAAECAATCTTRTGDSLQCVNVCRPEQDAVDQQNRELEQLQQQLAQAEAAATPDPDVILGLETDIADKESDIAALEVIATQCDDDCDALFATREAACTASCTPCSFNPAQWCIGGEIVELDGNPMFFPVEELMGSNADLDVAAIPEEIYGGNWTEDPSGELRNFYFTSEIAYWFEYTDGMTAQLQFMGDDDMWVFVNGKLAVDLGGLHVPVEGRFTLNANGTIDQIHGTNGTGDENEPATSSIANFGLEPGNVYEVKVFQAERKKTGSSYKLTLSGFNAGASDCMTDCGDGEVGPGEECDDGTGNTGEYNQCTADCSLGPRCGDGVEQAEEVCDLGAAGNDGSYGGCSASCTLGPYCGDGLPSDSEECDNGENVGGYGECAPGCVLGPVCGDGSRQLEFEECDDGNNADKDGCSAACKIELVVIK